jgi:rod shape-determining protein MreD
MIRGISIYGLYFVGLVLLQVLILNNIEISGFINPYFYILFILLLPFETPKWLLLVSAFALGLSIDLFSHTLGMHAFACVLVAYIRPFLLKVIAPREGYDAGTTPGVKYFGLDWFMRYAVIIVFTHHFALFFIETFKFHQFFSTLFRVILSSIFTLIIILLSQLLMVKR